MVNDLQAGCLKGSVQHMQSNQKQSGALAVSDSERPWSQAANRGESGKVGCLPGLQDMWGCVAQYYSQYQWHDLRTLHGVHFSGLRSEELLHEGHDLKSVGIGHAFQRGMQDGQQPACLLPGQVAG